MDTTSILGACIVIIWGNGSCFCIGVCCPLSKPRVDLFLPFAQVSSESEEETCANIRFNPFCREALKRSVKQQESVEEPPPAKADDGASGLVLMMIGFRYCFC